MKKSKAAFLNEEDFQKTILIKEGEVIREKDVLSFLNYLDNRYAISNFSLDYFLAEKTSKSSFWISLPYSKPGLATLEYIFICHHYLITGNYENRSKYIAVDIKKKLHNICWLTIERIKKLPLKSIDDFCIHTYIFFYLNILLDIEKVYGDIHSISKIYYQLISTIELFDCANRFTSFLNDVGNSISSFDNKIYNQLSDFNNNDIGIILNPINIKAYIQAINLSIDDEPCLIYGETGTGKELIAKTIHIFSNRNHNNFRSVNCGGFTDSLFQSEIQGIAQDTASNVRPRLGAFLSSCQRIIDNSELGYFINNRGQICFRSPNRGGNDLLLPPTLDEINEFGGTLFLDEINSLNMSHQSALLRIIQEKEVLVLGENTPRKYQSKLISASNIDLHNVIHKRNFRKDLYYRICVGEIHLPPLRKYKDYFNQIVRQRIAFIVNKINGDDIEIRKAAINKLKKYDWPGNFRELDNILYRSIKNAYIKNRCYLNASDIEVTTSKPHDCRLKRYQNMNYDIFKRDYFKQLYDMSGGIQVEAAKIAGISRHQVKYHWVKFGIL